MSEVKFYAKEIEQIDRGTSPEGHKYWNATRIGVFERTENGEVQVGEYERNYHTLYNTFHPFMQKGKWYALYSKDYTSTRVMSLPDCKDLAGEDRHTFGFCPTGYYVPWDNKTAIWAYNEGKQEDPNFPWEPGTFGFMCGCVWGDDSCWKIQFLDLSKIEEGILIRDDRFGYIEHLKSADKLSEAFDFYWLDQGMVHITCTNAFEMNKEKKSET